MPQTSTAQAIDYLLKRGAEPFSRKKAAVISGAREKDREIERERERERE